MALLVTFSTMNKGRWQCKPIGRGGPTDPQIFVIIFHMLSSACMNAAGDAIVRSRTTKVPTALQGCFNIASLTNTGHLAL